MPRPTALAGTAKDRKKGWPDASQVEEKIAGSMANTRVTDCIP
jgi:hypothetical protein